MSYTHSDQLNRSKQTLVAVVLVNVWFLFTVQGTDDAVHQLKLRSNRGDFLALWTRSEFDNNLAQKFVQSWGPTDRMGVINFNPNLPEVLFFSNSKSLKYPTFKRSDHSSFWYHGNSDYPATLSAILLTDLGK